jgi:hypothetical protein
VTHIAIQEQLDGQAGFLFLAKRHRLIRCNLGFTANHLRLAWRKSASENICPTLSLAHNPQKSHQLS